MRLLLEKSEEKVVCSSTPSSAGTALWLQKMFEKDFKNDIWPDKMQAVGQKKSVARFISCLRQCLA
jgi:hypothetical protein